MLYVLLFFGIAVVSGALLFTSAGTSVLLHVTFLASVAGFLATLLWRLNRGVRRASGIIDAGPSRGRNRG